MLKYHSAFFSDTTSFEAIFNQHGTELRYTLNGNEPTEQDLRYSAPITISKRTLVKVKAFAKDLLPSETVSADFIKNGKAIRAIRYSKPNESYTNSKADILNDNIGGIVNYRSGTWLGFDSDTITIDIELNKKESIHTVLINLLQDEPSWIFLPEQLSLYYYNAKENKFMPAGKESFSHERPLPKQCNVREIKSAPAVITDKLKLVLFSLKKIPGWHTGKGNHGWLFIDEIKVY
jgi:hypothetical protein